MKIWGVLSRKYPKAHICQIKTGNKPWPRQKWVPLRTLLFSIFGLQNKTISSPLSYLNTYQYLSKLFSSSCCPYNICSKGWVTFGCGQASTAPLDFDAIWFVMLCVLFSVPDIWSCKINNLKSVLKIPLLFKISFQLCCYPCVCPC